MRWLVRRPAMSARTPTSSCTWTRMRPGTTGSASRAKRPSCGISRPPGAGETCGNPIVLAKMAVTVDHLSGGRLEFGIGAGWAEVEHQMYGIAGLDHRVGYLSESLQIIKSLFTEERTNFEGRYYHFKDAIFNPKSIQKPYPPLWIGASGETTLRLVARHADVWNISGGDPEFLASLIAKFEEVCGAIGRDSSEIRRPLQFASHTNSKSDLTAKY